MIRTQGRPGRVRSEAATEAVRRSALALAGQLGPARVTVEAISKASGVAKTTIYRRWSHAGEVIMDAFLADIQPEIAYRNQGGLEATFTTALLDLSNALDAPRRDLLRHLIGAAQSDPALAKAFWERWIRPRREAAHEVLAAAGVGEAQGDVLLDLIFGAFYYRLLIPYGGTDPDWIRRVVRCALGSSGPTASGS